jgi:hypothetical protein
MHQKIGFVAYMNYIQAKIKPNFHYPPGAIQASASAKAPRPFDTIKHPPRHPALSVNEAPSMPSQH